MTKTKLTLMLASMATLSLAVPAYAQSSASSSTTGTGVVIAGGGGGFSSLKNLNDDKTADFKTGFNFGGALGIQFNQNVALRGFYTYGRSDTRGTALPAAIKEGTTFNRQFYGGELQLIGAKEGNVAPYLLLGGGQVRIKPDTTPAQNSFTKPAGKVGLGANFNLGNNAAFFVESSGLFYKFDQYGFNKAQFDLTWNAGLSVRLGK